MEAVVERLLWIVTACGVPFVAVPGRSCKETWGRRLGAATVRRAVAKFGVKSHVIVCFNRMGSQYTHSIECNISCNSKISLSG